MIDVKKLREKIAARNAEVEARSSKYADEWDAYLGEHREQWVAARGEQWYVSARLILKKINNREVITEKDVPPHRYGGDQDRFYSAPYRFADGRDKPRKAQVPHEVTQLLDALDLIGEDEISHTALGKMGCNNQVMTAVSRYLAGR